MATDVICDEGICPRTAYWVLTCGTTIRRVCGRHRDTAVRDLKFTHSGERITEDSGSHAVADSLTGR